MFRILIVSHPCIFSSGQDDDGVGDDGDGVGDEGDGDHVVAKETTATSETT